MDTKIDWHLYDDAPAHDADPRAHAPIRMPLSSLAPVSAGDPIAVRRRTLFDRIIAMDEPALAAMERCAGMIEGTH